MHTWGQRTLNGWETHLGKAPLHASVPWSFPWYLSQSHKLKSKCFLKNCLKRATLGVCTRKPLLPLSSGLIWGNFEANLGDRSAEAAREGDGLQVNGGFRSHSCGLQMPLWCLENACKEHKLYFTIHPNIKSLCCAPETNVLFYSK